LILNGADLFGDQIPEQSTAEKSRHQLCQENSLLRNTVLDQGRSEEWTDRRNGYNEERREADETRHVLGASFLIGVLPWAVIEQAD